MILLEKNGFMKTESLTFDFIHVLKTELEDILSVAIFGCLT